MRHPSAVLSHRAGSWRGRGPALVGLPTVAVACLVTACGSPASSTATRPSTSVKPTGACVAPSNGTSSKGPETAPPGDIPDNQAYVAFKPPSGTYTIKVPEGWGRAESGSTVSFTDKLNSVRVDLQPAAAGPTTASAQATEVPALKSHTACAEGVTVTTVDRPAGQAVLISYQMASAPDPVTRKVYRDDVQRYEFWKAGTEAVITLSSPVGSDNVDPWRMMTNSFGWT